MIQPNRQDKYSFATTSLASVFLLTRSHRCPIVPPGPPDHHSTKGPVSHHVVHPQSTNKPRTASDHRTNDTRFTAASVCRLYSQPRPHCSSATLSRFALQLARPVVCRRSSKWPVPATHSGERVHCSLWPSAATVAVHHSKTGIPHYRPSTPNFS